MDYSNANDQEMKEASLLAHDELSPTRQNSSQHSSASASGGGLDLNSSLNSLNSTPTLSTSPDLNDDEKACKDCYSA